MPSARSDSPIYLSLTMNTNIPDSPVARLAPPCASAAPAGAVAPLRLRRHRRCPAAALDQARASALFPADNWWNTDVSAAPVDPHSAGFINFLGAGVGLHPDFGGRFRSLSRDLRHGLRRRCPAPSRWCRSPSSSIGERERRGSAGAAGRLSDPGGGEDAGEVDRGGISRQRQPRRRPPHADRRPRPPPPLRALPHALERRPRPLGGGLGRGLPLDSNLRRPDGWTSADAAGLAILPGLVRYDEAFGTAPIQHAFRFTVEESNGYVFPASHDAGGSTRRAADGRPPAPQGGQGPLGLPARGAARSSRR